MNHCMRRVLLSLVLLASVLVGAENPQVLPRNKGNVRYSVRPNYSRFFLLFRGPVQYQEDLQGNTLTLTVGGIKSAPSELGSNLQFQDGLIARAFVGRISNASSKVVLTLRDGFGKYSIGRMDGLDALIIDILPTGTTAQSPPALSPVARHSRPQKENLSTASTPGQTPIVDIAALVRKQLEEPETQKGPLANQAAATTAAKQQPQASAQKSVAATGSDVWLVLLSLSTMVTMVALVGLVFVALRRKSLSRISSQEQELRNEMLLNQTKLAQNQAAAVTRPVQRATLVDEESELFEGSYDVRALQIAEQYHRSQGEAELAMRLHEQPGLNDHTRKIKTIKATGLPHRGKLTAAKKLGVGKGELDLASKLQQLKEALSEKEEIA